MNDFGHKKQNAGNGRRQNSYHEDFASVADCKCLAQADLKIAVLGNVCCFCFLRVSCRKMRNSVAVQAVGGGGGRGRGRRKEEGVMV